MDEQQELPIVSLSFILDVVDDWPPVAVESLPCVSTPEGFRVCESPLFIKGISVGDVISIERDDEGYVRHWHHVFKSNTSTIWLLRLMKTNSIEITLENLRLIGCKTVQLPKLGAYAIEVSSTCNISEVDSILESLDSQEVAVAYPSFRHADL